MKAFEFNYNGLPRKIGCPGDVRLVLYDMTVTPDGRDLFGRLLDRGATEESVNTALSFYKGKVEELAGEFKSAAGLGVSLDDDQRLLVKGLDLYVEYLGKVRVEGPDYWRQARKILDDVADGAGRIIHGAPRHDGEGIITRESIIHFAKICKRMATG
jgi:hypothetical protein